LLLESRDLTRGLWLASLGGKQIRKDGLPMRVVVETSRQRPVIVDLNGYDRIRARSSERANAQVAQKIEEDVRRYSRENNAVLSGRIDELEHEWDLDRAVMLLFSIVGGAVLALGLTKSRKWLALMMIQLPLLAFHAIFGWSPPASLFRRLGFRSPQEIDSEKYALRTLRGDYNLRESGRTKDIAV
jgi:hypothetical protein